MAFLAFGSLHERSLAALLLDLVALKLLGQKHGFLTRLLVAWRGFAFTMLASLWLCLADPTLCHALLVDRNKHVFLARETGFGLTVACFAFIATMLRIHA